MNILEVQLLCADISQTRHFYHHSLGMDILYEDNHTLKLSAGLSTLVFKKDESAGAVYHFAFNIPSNQFSLAHSWASANLSLIQVKDDDTVANFVNWNAKALYFFDNNGNIVEFIARFDLDNHSDKPFDGSSVCSISELGIVVSEARPYAEHLIKEYSLNYFHRQPPGDGFIALGDDDGLFIIVNEHRHWYPTDRPGGRYWFKARFTHGDKSATITMQDE